MQAGVQPHFDRSSVVFFVAIVGVAFFALSLFDKPVDSSLAGQAWSPYDCDRYSSRYSTEDWYIASCGSSLVGNAFGGTAPRDTVVIGQASSCEADHRCEMSGARVSALAAERGESGNAYVCADAHGVLFRSSQPCN